MTLLHASRFAIRRFAAAAAMATTLTAAHSAPLAVSAVMTPREQIRLDFQDGSGHFVLMVHREGRASGNGLFDGAHVDEYGRHDIVPGVGGDPSGYLVVSKGRDDSAYVKWTVRSIFLPGSDGKETMADNGFWEIVSGTGAFKGLKGAGTLHIKSVSPVDRLFVLDGTLVPANP